MSSEKKKEKKRRRRVNCFTLLDYTALRFFIYIFILLILVDVAILPSRNSVLNTVPILACRYCICSIAEFQYC